MKKVFIIHGFKGAPNGGWRPWLMRELDKHGVFACALEMPTPDAPKLDEWLKEVAYHMDKQNPADEIYLVGHSLGATTVLRYLELEDARSVSGVVLASGLIKSLDRADLEEFVQDPFNFEVIRSKALLRTVIHGEDDDRVPFEHAQILSHEIDAELIPVPNGGHLNGKSGWYELPQALEMLLKWIKPF